MAKKLKVLHGTGTDLDLYPELTTEVKPDDGVGVLFDYEGLKYKTNRRTHKSQFEVVLRISTFRGVSIGAVHHYGSLWVSGLDLECCQDDDWGHKMGDVIGLSGSIDKAKPKGSTDIHVELKRFITKAELKTERFETYRHFDNPDTRCFDTKDDVRAEAKRVFEKFFKDPRWKLKERDW